CVAEIPVLQAPQLGQIHPTRRVLERVLIHPAEPCRIRTERGRDACRQLPLQPAEVLQYSTACPVQIRVVVEDHVDERHAKERVPSHRGRARHLEHLGRDGIGDLVLDDLWRLFAVVRLNDYLYIGEVRQRLERRVPNGPDTTQDGRYRE